MRGIPCTNLSLQEINEVLKPLLEKLPSREATFWSRRSRDSSESSFLSSVGAASNLKVEEEEAVAEQQKKNFKDRARFRVQGLTSFMDKSNQHDASVTNATEEKIVVMGKANDEQLITSEEEMVKQQVENMVVKVDELEQRINKVAQFYSSLSKKKSNNTKGNSIKDKERDKVTANLKRQEAAQREIASERRMQELIRQFGTILRQIMQHKWAWPFMEPVDVEGLGLHDYYKVIEKPMDFSTIKNLMESKDGSGYKNVRDIYADVRLVFNNAMKYNVETDDVHVMAKTLLGKFEEKWLQLLPKVIEEERRRKKEEEEAKMNLQAAEEATVAKLAADLNNELDELNLHLDDLRERVMLKCRVMSTEEKRQLGANLSRLSPEDLTKALEIIAERNPSFLLTAEEVDLDIDAQSPSTLWRVKFFVKEALDLQARGSVNKDNANPKRKREVNDAVNKNVKKRSKKIAS